jgi:hypothetical protein
MSMLMSHTSLHFFISSHHSSQEQITKNRRTPCLYIDQWLRWLCPICCVLILATDLYKNTVVCYFSYLRLGTRLVSSIVFSYAHVACQNYRLKSQREKCDGILWIKYSSRLLGTIHSNKFQLYWYKQVLRAIPINCCINLLIKPNYISGLSAFLC